MSARTIRMLLRSLTRQKSFVFINITGLAVGIACCLFILLWIQDELSFDTFHLKKADIFRITGWWEKNGWQGLEATPEPLAPAIKQGIPEILRAARFASHQRLVFRYQEKAFYEDRGIIADPELFEIFSFDFIRGNPETAFLRATDLVLTEALAAKYFPDQDPLGKIILIEGHLATVTGVIRNPPQNSSLQFDFMNSFEFIKELSGWGTGWGSLNFATFVLLQEKRDLEVIGQKITQIALNNKCPQVESGLYYQLQPLSQIHLDARPYQISWVVLGDSKYVTLFSLVAVFILLIACVNFMNLSTARSTLRIKEIAMRKTMGASRSRLIRQFLGESLGYALLAGVMAVGLVLILLPLLNRISSKNLIFDMTRPSLILGTTAVVFLAGLVSGSYPALYLSRFSPAAILSRARRPQGRGGGFRKTLVVAQFSLSGVLLLSTLVLYQQLHYIHNKGLGLDIDEIVYLPIKENIGTQFQALRSELLASTDVVSVTAHSYNFATSVNRAAGWNWEGRDPDQEDSLDLILSGVDYDFFKTLGIKIAEGRSFSREYSTDPKQAYMLNRAAVKAMQLKKPVGTGFFWPEREGSIIGVVEDVHFRSLNWEIAPRLYYMLDITHATGGGIVLIKFQGTDRQAVLSRLEQIWKKINPMSPFEFSFLDQTYDNLYRREQQTVLIFNLFTALAIGISCLGLFGLALFMTEQRTKEIGIRKVLGASAANIVLLLSRDFVKWVLLANAIAWPLGYYAMFRLLEPFAYRTRISPLLFLLSGSLSLLIAWLTVSVQSWKAAASHPADSLRWE